MAEISNIVEIFSVLVLLAVMLCYLFHLTINSDLFSGMGGTSTVFYPRKTQSLSMVKVQNPFSFKLNDANKSTLDKVSCLISSECDKCTVNAYWGIDLYQFHASLGLDWPTFKERLREETFLIESCGLKSPTESFSNVITNQNVTLKPPIKINPNDLGKSPRTKYPLLVLIIREDDFDLNADSVVLMAVVIHVQDELCQMESRVLTQYLKQANGRTCCLKPLYIPESDNTSNYENTQVNPEQDSTNRLCVVCQANAISHVCLPCRHTCVCESCFHLIDKCPLCRSIITSFFSVSNDEETFTRTRSGDSAFPLRQRHI